MTGAALTDARRRMAGREPTAPAFHGDGPAGAGRSLLAAWRAYGQADLGAHLWAHGPLPVLDGRAIPHFLHLVAEAGLTGRGGGGFPTARKLDGHRRAGGGTVVVNVMEGEPASAKDAVLARCAPHLLLDGAHCAAAVTGARRIVVCVADDRDDIARPLAAALAARRPHAPGTSAGAWAEVALARPPARYVGGEESALVDWLARGRGVPQFRVDKAVALRLGRRPVVVQNAETMAHLALLARAIDRPATPQPLTTLVTVSGPVTRPGVHEITVGTSLADVLAGAAPVVPVGGVLVGGFGGSWLAASDLTRPFSAAGLAPVGASPGAGVLDVLGASACGLVHSAAIASAMAGESAGQCGPCVYGLPAVATDLAALAAGRADRALLARLHARLDLVENRGACRHPDGVARMVRSALRVFAHDVAAHATGRPCPDARAARGPAAARSRDRAPVGGERRA